MFSENQFSSLRILKVFDKDVYIVDRHQFVLPIWSYYSNKEETSYELVSIDYHPDTNPPFWQKAYYKAIVDNREDDDNYILSISESMISNVNPSDYASIINQVENLNNDEHINSAMKLGYLNDYHMINCMDKHTYESGTHYLIDERYFGSLSDEMFNSIGFKTPSNPYILDIDLDYFLLKSNFNRENITIFEKLVKNAEFITVARSIKYFNYLRREEFDIELCEQLLINLFKDILK